MQIKTIMSYQVILTELWRGGDKMGFTVGMCKMVQPNKGQSGMIYYNHACAESRKLQSHYCIYTSAQQFSKRDSSGGTEKLVKEVCKRK